MVMPSGPGLRRRRIPEATEGGLWNEEVQQELFDKFINKVNGAFGVEDVIDIINRLPNIENITFM